MQQFSAFRLTPQQAQKKLHDIDKCCASFYPVLCSIYYAASASMNDCLSLLRPRKEFRHAVKHGCNAALAAYDKIERRLRTTLADRYQLWLDVSDEVYEELRPAINDIRYTCTRYLRYKHVPDYEFKAQLQTAVIVNDIAASAFTRLMRQFRDVTGYDLAPLFVGGTFRDVASSWKRAVTPLLHSGTSADINLNKSTSLNKAVRSLIRLISDNEVYNRAAERALRENPDAWKHLSQPDQAALREGQPLSRA